VWGVGWGVWGPRPNPQTPTPQSPIPNPHFMKKINFLKKLIKKNY